MTVCAGCDYKTKYLFEYVVNGKFYCKRCFEEISSVSLDNDERVIE
jgi:hypothetical protein